MDEPLAGQPGSIVDGIANAKKVTIEVPFYQDGSQQLTFNVAGLDRKRL